MTRLILLSFRLHGALLGAGNRLTQGTGLSSARWQVLSAVARSVQPMPVAWVARDMGLTRQSVQRVADDLEAAGLISFQPNPHHKRAPVLLLTEKGQRAFAAITAKQVPWVNRLAEEAKVGEIETAIDILQMLCRRLETDQSR